MRIDVLSAIAGRQLINDLFHKIRYENQRSGIATAFILWRICISNFSINYYQKQDIHILHKLGFIKGTILWLEEVINRFNQITKSKNLINSYQNKMLAGYSESEIDGWIPSLQDILDDLNFRFIQFGCV